MILFDQAIKDWQNDKGLIKSSLIGYIQMTYYNIPKQHNRVYVVTTGKYKGLLTHTSNKGGKYCITKLDIPLLFNCNTQKCDLIDICKIKKNLVYVKAKYIENILYKI